jgi:TonB-linked SusC/RagA family outer membrane protein
MFLKIMWNYPFGKKRYFKKTLLIMKLTAILLFAACLQVSATGYSQKITLSQNNVSLRQVFKEIGNQSGYQFFYKDRLIRQAHDVSIHVTNVSVEEALYQCLKDQPLTYTILDKIIVVKAKPSLPFAIQALAILPAVPINIISGTVKDEKGNPLVGVSVILKGTNKGTSTNAEGRFTIDANNGEVLEFTFVGYQKRSVTVRQGNSLSVVMEIEAAMGNEVVIVGYGTQKKVDLTGAVAQVSGKRLQDRPITNVSDGLQGVIANLNVTTTGDGGGPGATKSINIRGYTGLGSSSSPLILVDGVPGDINSINPSDIESITVLKDAASSAIYGSRAPYGVILIKTKQGKKGQPLTVSLNSNFSNSQPLDVPKMMNSLQFAQIYNEAFVNAGQSPWISDATIARIKQYMADPTNTPTTIVDPNNPTKFLSWNGANANNDWFKVYLKKWSPSQQHNLNVSGGSENITYFLGLGYNQKNGLFNYFHDNFDRYNYRANVTAKVNKWMSLALKSSYAQKNSNSPYAGADIGYNWFHQIPRRFPTVPVKDPNGNYTIESYIPEIMNGGRNISTTNDSWITTDLILTPAKGWVVDANYSYNYYTGVSSSTQLPFTYFLADNTPTRALK